MGVIRTDKWLNESFEKPIEICEKFSDLFNGAHPSEIYDYLTFHGMYQPFGENKEIVKTLQRNNVWEVVQKESHRLQNAWEGPSIPIFIFPSDKTNEKIKHDFNGKSGLAFKDKLFLFISEENTEKEIRALLTHEYNHVCRLSTFPKNEEDYVLLDTIILEGLAEHAVRERLGKEYLAAWTSYYAKEELETMWKNVVLPNKDVPIRDRKHQDILYGTRSYQKMLGYCVGYHLINKYIEATNKTSKALLALNSEHLAQLQ